jgi:hypothetical protein
MIMMYSCPNPASFTQVVLAFWRRDANVVTFELREEYVVEQDWDREENVEFGRRGEFDSKRGCVADTGIQSLVFFFCSFLCFFQSCMLH